MSGIEDRIGKLMQQLLKLEAYKKDLPDTEKIEIQKTNNLLLDLHCKIEDLENILLDQNEDSDEDSLDMMYPNRYDEDFDEDSISYDEVFDDE